MPPRSRSRATPRPCRRRSRPPKRDHARDGLKALEDGAWKSRIAEKKVAGVPRWHGDADARRAVYNNRARLRSGVARAAFKRQAELCERSFALIGKMDLGRHDGPGVEIHRVLGFVGEMCAAVLQLGDPRLGIAR